MNRAGSDEATLRRGVAGVAPDRLLAWQAICRRAALHGCGLAVVLCFQWITLAERLACETRPNGTLSLQIQNAQPGAYSVRLYDLLNQREVGCITNLVGTGAPGQRAGEWQPNLTNSVLVAHLFRDGVEIPMPLPALQTPDLWQVAPARVDRRANLVEWTLPSASLARVRALLSSGLEIADIKDWHFSPGTPQSAPWDFADEQRTANYRESTTLKVWVQNLPLPAPLVVLGEPDFAPYRAHPLFRALDLPRMIYDLRVSVGGAAVRPHPSEPGHSIPVVTPGSVVQVRLTPEARRLLGQTRYEVLFFADGDFVREDTEAVDPCAIILPALPAATGLIHFSTMVRDYTGNAGSRTIPVWYQPAPEAAR